MRSDCARNRIRPWHCKKLLSRWRTRRSACLKSSRQRSRSRIAFCASSGTHTGVNSPCWKSRARDHRIAPVGLDSVARPPRDQRGRHHRGRRAPEPGAGGRRHSRRDRPRSKTRNEVSGPESLAASLDNAAPVEGIVPYSFGPRRPSPERATVIVSLCMSKATNFVDLRMASSFSLGIGLWVN